MTDNRGRKHAFRERQAKIGGSPAAAPARASRERDRLREGNFDNTGRPAAQRRPTAASDPPRAVEAVVLKLNRSSARVRILDDNSQVTFRSDDLRSVVPGQIVTLDIARRWSWRGDACASGRVRDPRIDIPRLGLVPLPLTEGDLVDIGAEYEPPRRRDPRMPLWRRLTSRPRRAFVFDGIAWGNLPGLEGGDNPTCRAAELVEEGDDEGAYRILMDALLLDLRCIDAHAHLGNLEFDHDPERAALHYRVGLGIGEFSLPENFDGILPWGMVFNRPFLRCLHGLGLCLWRAGKMEEALAAFERILMLNPNDNQGARFCWQDVRAGRTWEEAQARAAEEWSRSWEKL